jgi:chemotaxis response regulator CheB
MSEVFKNIGNNYQVSNLGRVKSFVTSNPKLLKGTPNSKGYPVITMKINGNYKTIKIHRLVALTFIPNPENKPCVNHKDGNKQNNKAENLEWVTKSENTLHAYKNNLMSSGKNKRNSKLSKDEVTQIRDLYKNKIYKIDELSVLYGMSKGGTANIVYNNVWRNI